MMAYTKMERKAWLFRIGTIGGFDLDILFFSDTLCAKRGIVFATQMIKYILKLVLRPLEIFKYSEHGRKILPC